MRAAVYLLLAGISLEPGGLDRHPWAQAVEVSNRYYVVETNTFPELARDLASQLKRAYPFFEDRFGPLKGKARLPMRVALFRTRQEYYMLGDGVRGAVGHFDAALDRCAIVWRGGTGERGWPVAVHEATHHYVRRRYPDAALPSWYSEGVACYFEGVLDPTSERAAARLRIRAAQAARKDGEASLDLLLATRARVSRGRLMLQNFAPTRFYGLAWSLVHFLATDPRYGDGFRRFELRLFASRPAAGHVAQVARKLLAEECGDLAVLERRWREHLAALPAPKPPVAAPVYAWELDSVNPYVRYAALSRLGGRRPPRDLHADLRRRLRDRDLIVRTQATRVVAKAMSSGAVPALTESLDLGDQDLKAAALRALAFQGAGAAVPRLLEERDERAAAVRALATIRDPRAYGLLRAALRDPRMPAATRARCAEALAADPRAERTLNAVLTDRQPIVRGAARSALRRAGKTPQTAATAMDAATRDRHLDTLRDASASYRAMRRACRMLALARVQEAVPLLKRLCRPRIDDRIRSEAVRALARITGETRGYQPAQRATAREEVYRRWAEEAGAVSREP